jgi:sugar phosphate isomerase/epimerase
MIRSAGQTAELGIFARVFPRSDAASVASAVAAAGYRTVQLNLSSVGLPTVPPETHWDAIDLGNIRDGFADAGVRIWGVSATVNLIHPDVGRRTAERRDVVALLERVGVLDPVAVTLCTGTRDPDDQWRRHPGNDDLAAWHDLLDAMDVLVRAAERAGITLGVEPEPGNVVANATVAARLFDELHPPSGTVGVVLDPANLLDDQTVADQRRVLSEAMSLLGDEVICLHAKDVSFGVAPGFGAVDYELIFDLWAALPEPVPVIVQDVTEDQAPTARAVLTEFAENHPWRGRAR